MKFEDSLDRYNMANKLQILLYYCHNFRHIWQKNSVLIYSDFQGILISHDTNFHAAIKIWQLDQALKGDVHVVNLIKIIFQSFQKKRCHSSGPLIIIFLYFPCTFDRFDLRECTLFMPVDGGRVGLSSYRSSSYWYSLLQIVIKLNAQLVCSILQKSYLANYSLYPARSAGDVYHYLCF